MKASKALLLLFSLTIIGFACKKTWERPGWDSNIVAPLVKSSLSMKNIIRDTSRIKINPDNSLTLVNRDSVGGISLDTLVALNTPTFEQTRRVDQIELAEKKDTTSLTMGQLLRNAGVNPTQNNFQLFFFPNTPFSFNNITIDISEFFEMARIKSGMLKVDVINGLPLDLTNVTFNLTNGPGGNVVYNQTGINVPHNSLYTDTESLAGVLVDQPLKGEISGTAGRSSMFTVDTNATIQVIMTISNVKVDSATAIFPQQRLLDNTDIVILQGMGDVQLTYAKVKSGYVVAEAVSTIEDSLFFEYNMPNAIDKYGQPFRSSNALPPAPANGSINKAFEYNFEGFALDLKGRNLDTVNTFVNQLTADIHYSGNLLTLSLRDSLRMRVATKDLVPSYVEGYLGRDTIFIGPSTIDLPLFNNIVDGSINFEEADLKFVIENGMGMPAEITIFNITAFNTKKGTSVPLSGTNINNAITIPAATNNPHVFGVQPIDLGSANHNSTALLNLMPNKIQYYIRVITNPSGVVNLNQFAYLDKTLRANLDVSIPLSIISTNLTLMDTVAMNPEGIKKRNITQGKINVVADNGFPIEAELEMYLMDDFYNVTDTLRSSQTALAALTSLVGGDYRVTNKQRSVISFEADETRMNNLYNAKYVAFKARFNTEPSTTHLKIYSDYSIDFQIVGDVNYRF